MSSFKPSRLLSTFEESATLALSGKAKRLQQEGRSIINFGVGEPDFNTPSPIIEKAFEAAKKGQTKYTAVAGTQTLRQALLNRLSSDYQISFSSLDEVMVSLGGKQAIYHFFQAVLEPGDEVLIPAPYWVSFPEMVKLVGAKPVIVQPSGDRLSALDLEKSLTPKTRLLILNSPSNPSGVVFSPSELSSFLKVVESKSVWILSDDTYYRLVYPPAEWVSILKLRPDLRERICIVGSASKSYAMTGWRIGWAIASKSIISAMVKLQSQVTSSACHPAQAALEAALKDYHETSTEFREIFRKRRDFFLEKVQKISGFKVIKPEGAFYLFVDFGQVLKGRSVLDYANDLLEKHGVCIIPGEAFGAPSFARLSYALSESEIEEGVKRIRASLGPLGAESP